MKSKRILPPSWVDRIFARLDNIYGTEFTRLYSRVINGTDEGIEAAKTTWAEELGHFVEWPEAIAWALDINNLPERPPNLVTFLKICRTAPRKEAPGIEHKFSDEEIAANRERIRGHLEALKAALTNGKREILQ